MCLAHGGVRDDLGTCTRTTQGRMNISPGLQEANIISQSCGHKFCTRVHTSNAKHARRIDKPPVTAGVQIPCAHLFSDTRSKMRNCRQIWPPGTFGVHIPGATVFRTPAPKCVTVNKFCITDVRIWRVFYFSSFLPPGRHTAEFLQMGSSRYYEKILDHLLSKIMDHSIKDLD